MSQKPDEGVCVFGALVLTRYLKALRQEIDGVRKAEDIEYIHRMRVASRRFRDALPLFSSCLPQRKYPGWNKQVRLITRALGGARDTDVGLAALIRFYDAISNPLDKPGIRRLILRLRQKRTKFQQKVISALDSLETSKALDEIEKHLEPLLDRQNQTYLYTPMLYQHGYQAITSRLASFLNYETYVEKPECIEELHAMRIASKHLRYTMEVFATLYPGELKDPIQTSRKNQDLLGEIHDSDVWIAFLPGFIEQERLATQEFYGHLRGFRRLIPGILAYQEDRQQAREQFYADFVAFWRQQKEQKIWENLSAAIQIPFFKQEQPTPAANSPAPQPKEDKAEPS
ncbi:MAG: CHAD domain-containing protein [Chloroflexi bacterium]|nr:CHAD domain-containing protein [Chloroflexota bacterium]